MQFYLFNICAKLHHREFSKEDKKFFIRSPYEYKGYNARQFIAEFLDKGWTKNCINRLLVKLRTFGTVDGPPGKSGDVENNCTSHKSILCAISVSKIIKVGGNLTKLWQKQFCTVFLAGWGGMV